MAYGWRKTNAKIIIARLSSPLRRLRPHDEHNIALARPLIQPLGIRRGHVDTAVRDRRSEVVVPVRAVKAQVTVIGHEIWYALQVIDADGLGRWPELCVLSLVEDVAPVRERPGGIPAGRDQGGEDEFAVIVDA